MGTKRTQHDDVALNDARTEIAADRLLFLAVDSNAFFTGDGDARTLNLNQPWLAKFKRLCIVQNEKLILSWVWDVEIQHHLDQAVAASAAIHIPKISKLATELHHIRALETRGRELMRDARKAAKEQWRGLKSRFNVEIVGLPVEGNWAADVLQLWARPAPPLENRRSKKNEFPDAFALISLNAHAEAVGAKILVVTGDEGCRDYCRTTTRLLPCSDVSKAIALLEQRVTIRSQQEMDKLLSCSAVQIGPRLLEKLQQALDSAHANCPFPGKYYSFFLNGKRSQGRITKHALESAVFLPTGPLGNLVHVAANETATGASGRVRLEITATLKRTGYDYGAVPSEVVLVEDGTFMLEAKFYAHCEKSWSSGLSIDDFSSFYFELPDELLNANQAPDAAA